MSLRHRSSFPHGLFFVTTSTHRRIIRFSNPGDYDILVTNIAYYCKRDQVSIHGFVLMPNHFHLILTIPEGRSLSAFMRDLKKRVAYEYFMVRNAPIKKFWQDRFDDLLITREPTFRTKLNYVHWNPVRAGLVSKPEDWPYSSALYYLAVGRPLIPVVPVAVASGSGT